MDMSDATEGAPFWQLHIAVWQQSGLTQKAYCEQQELRYSTFGYWVRKRKRPRIHTCFPHLTLCRLSPEISRHRRNRWTCLMPPKARHSGSHTLRPGNKEEGGGLCAGDPGHGTAHRPDPEPAQRPGDPRHR
ncbi:IS66 family insertion sequence element accessory protein TnpA, partial [Thiolapillus sp.]